MLTKNEKLEVLRKEQSKYTFKDKEWWVYDEVIKSVKEPLAYDVLRENEELKDKLNDYEDALAEIEYRCDSADIDISDITIML